MANDKTFTVSVDGEPVDIPRKAVTPNQILEAAGLDPSKLYLIEKKGKTTTSHKDGADDEINVHEKQTFVTAKRGPVPVA